MKKRMEKKNNLKWILISIISLGIAFIVFTALITLFSGENLSGNTAHIKVRGVITSGESFFAVETSSSEDVVENIRKADENPRIKAILLDINSPGGSPVSSEEITAAVKSAEKPVVALIRDIGTSGAYWIASASDAIVASPLSITGSVGATAAYLEFSELMKKYGIGYERLVSGELKDTGTPFRKLSGEEEKLLQEIIRLTGSYFANSVKENRQLSDEAVEEISSGRIYTGQQAQELNLIDELGNIEKAKQLIKEKAGLEKVKLVEYKIKKPFSIASLLSQQAAVVGKSMGAALLPKESAISLS